MYYIWPISIMVQCRPHDWELVSSIPDRVTIESLLNGLLCVARWCSGRTPDNNFWPDVISFHDREVVSSIHDRITTSFFSNMWAHVSLFAPWIPWQCHRFSRFLKRGASPRTFTRTFGILLCAFFVQWSHNELKGHLYYQNHRESHIKQNKTIEAIGPWDISVATKADSMSWSSVCSSRDK
jgi:hypothetical protein